MKALLAAALGAAFVAAVALAFREPVARGGTAASPRLGRVDAPEKAATAESGAKGPAAPVASDEGSTPRVGAILPGSAGLTGRIVDEAGAPIEGAEVTLVLVGDRAVVWSDARIAPGDVVAKGRANGDGRVLIEGIPPVDPLHISVTAAGRAQIARAEEFALEAGATLEIGDVVLPVESRIEGELVDDDGTPIAELRAVVELLGFTTDANLAERLRDGWSYSVGEWSRAVTTDEQGRFSIGGLHPLATKLWVSAQDRVPAPCVDIAVRRGPNTVPPITMHRERLIRGLVVNACGVPMSHVEVGLVKVEGVVLDECGSDENGMFVLGGAVPPQEYGLVMRYQDDRHSSDVRVRAGQEGVALQWIQPPGIQLRLVDAATSKAIEYASVRFEVLHPAHRAQSYMAYRCEEPGVYRMSYDEEWDGTLVVHASGYHPSAAVDVHPRTSSSPEVQAVALERAVSAFRVRGRVIDRSTKNPLRDAGIALFRASSSEEAMVRQQNCPLGFEPVALLEGNVSTDEEGRFELMCPGAGRYRVGAACELYSWRWTISGDLDLNAANPCKEVSLEAAVGGTLAGIVRGVDNRPAPGVIVSVKCSDGTWVYQQTTVGGRFRFEGLRAGRTAIGFDDLQLRVSPRAGEPASARTIVLSDGLESTLDLDVRDVRAGRVTGTLRGLARDQRFSVSIAPDPTFYGESAGEALPTIFGTSMSECLSVDGSFTFSAVEAGRYRVKVHYAEAHSEIMSQGGIEVAPLVTRVVNLVLPGAILKGRVVGRPEAGPLERASIRCWRTTDVEGGIQAHASTSTHVDGRFELPCLPEGTYVLDLEADGFVSQRWRVHVPGEPITLVLDPAGGVVVKAKSTLGFDDVTFSLVMLDVEPNRPWDGMENTSDFGKRTWENVPPGRYRIEATGLRNEAIAARGSAEISVKVGQTASVSVDLKPVDR